MRVIGDQIIAPAAIERRLLLEHAERCPGWLNRRELSRLDEVAAVEESLWPLCDLLVCGSEFVRRSLESVGIEPGRIDVIEHPLNSSEFPYIDRADRGQRVTIGFVGQISLRKGVPYLLQAANKLPSRYRVVCAGALGVCNEAIRPFAQRVEFRGRVAPRRVPMLMREFDLFVFPSLCEGSASAVNEAMASGLPVICTTNSGSRIRDGVDGFIVSAGDVDGMVERIVTLGENVSRRKEMGRAAHERVAAYSREEYAQVLKRAVLKVSRPE
jgi:glycosyltransferase involved in cell wall biosynthesis